MFTYPVVEFADPNFNNPNNDNNINNNDNNDNNINNDIKYIETSIDETHNYINKIKDNFKKILTFRDNKYKNILNELEMCKSENKLLTKEKAMSYIECMTLKNEVNNLQKLLGDATSNKAFEENNYNNVSMLKNLSNQILEKDNEIRALKAFKELTNKLKHVEPVKVIEPETIKIIEPETIKIIEPEPVNVIEPEPIKVIIKSKSTSKTKDTKKLDTKPDEIIIETNIPDTKIILKSKRVVKPKSKQTVDTEYAPILEIEPNITPILPLPIIENTIEPVKIVKTKPDKKLKIKTDKNIIVETVNAVTSVISLNEETNINEVTKLNEVTEVTEVTKLNEVTEETNIIEVTKVTEETNIIEVSEETNIIEVFEETKVIEVSELNEIVKVTEITKDIKVIDEEPLKQVITKKSIVFPSVQPDNKNLEVKEIDNIDYYLDNTTNNVYQLINGDDLGAFLGVYNKQKNCIEQI